MVHPALKTTHAITGAVEQEARPVVDEARAIARQARSAIDTSAEAVRSSLEASEIQDGAARLTRRVARAADALRGADDLDGPTQQEISDRERVRSALVAGVVLAVMSAIVFLVAREAARGRRAASLRKEMSAAREARARADHTRADHSRGADPRDEVADGAERPASSAKPIAALNRQ